MAATLRHRAGASANAALDPVGAIRIVDDRDDSSDSASDEDESLPTWTPPTFTVRWVRPGPHLLIPADQGAARRHPEALLPAQRDQVVALHPSRCRLHRGDRLRGLVHQHGARRARLARRRQRRARAALPGVGRLRVRRRAARHRPLGHRPRVRPPGLQRVQDDQQRRRLGPALGAARAVRRAPTERADRPATTPGASPTPSTTRRPAT